LPKLQATSGKSAADQKFDELFGGVDNAIVVPTETSKPDMTALAADKSERKVS
jgi:hypothetical protein